MGKTGHPQARDEGLVVCELHEELLLYDIETHDAHWLNETATAVWKQCDGRRSVAQIAAQVSAALGKEIDSACVWLALEELWKRDLLVSEPAPGDEATFSRSHVLRRSGLVAAAVAVPVVMSVVAPTAAHAASCLGPGSPCTVGLNQCCPGLTCAQLTGGGGRVCA